MNALEERLHTGTPGRRFQPLVEGKPRGESEVLTLVATEMVGTPRWNETLKDKAEDTLRHILTDLIRTQLDRGSTGWRLDGSRKGILIAFPCSLDAVKFAVGFVSQFRAICRSLILPVHVRVGIHRGEVFLRKSTDGGDGYHVAGSCIGVARRIAALARPGQVLTSEAVFQNAMPPVVHATSHGIAPIRWKQHGACVVRETRERVALFEVEEGRGTPIVATSDTQSPYIRQNESYRRREVFDSRSTESLPAS